jgi:hypothetical protein
MGTPIDPLDQFVWGAEAITKLAGRVNEDGSARAPFHFTKQLEEAGVVTDVNGKKVTTPRRLRNHLNRNTSNKDKAASDKAA